MARRPDCIDDILKNIGDRGSRKYVEDHLEELLERAERDTSGDSESVRMARAAKELINDSQVEAAILARNMRMDAIKHRDLRTYVDSAPTARLGLEASLAGINRPFHDPKGRSGNQLSAAAIGLGAARAWIGEAISRMEKLGRTNPDLVGLDSLFASRKIEREIFIEKIELEKGARGTPGRTKNKPALEIAKILIDVDKTKINALNAEGAWIKEHSTYGASTRHDPNKMLGAAGNRFFKFVTGKPYRVRYQEAREQWASKTLQWIDAKKMFGTDNMAHAKEALADMFNALVYGHDGGEPFSVFDENNITNVARRLSQHREFAWKSPEAWLDYMDAFGGASPTEAWFYGMRYSANRYGLMKVFGSKPREGFDETFKYAKEKTTGTEQGLELEQKQRMLLNRFNVVSGEADRPVANMMSGLVDGMMAVQRTAKLGLTPFAMLADNVNISRELARNGMNYMDRNASLMTGYFRGAVGSEKREVADILHSGFMGRIRSSAARVDIQDAPSKWISAMDYYFFKMTGITAMTENKRADAERMMAYHFGRFAKKDFAALGPRETRMMESFGIGPEEWNLLNSIDWDEVGGKRYFTPDIAEKLPDADVKAYLEARSPLSERAAMGVKGPQAALALGDPAEDVLNRTRRDLGMKIWSYYGARGHYAVLEAGAREKATLYQGTQAGTPLNLALRMMFQFKSFPVAALYKSWGAEIYGGEKGMGRVAGMAEFVVMATLYGMVGNYLNQIAKGQDPNSQIRNNPAQWIIAGFLRGGAGAIYGDFLLGEWNRFGMSVSASALGPTFSQVDQVAELWSNLTHLKEASQSGALATRMVRQNLPFMNTIYTKMAFDYLIFYKLQEYFSPGYLSRYEDTMKQRSGIEFWLRPSQVSR